MALLLSLDSVDDICFTCQDVFLVSVVDSVEGPAIN